MARELLSPAERRLVRDCIDAIEAGNRTAAVTAARQLAGAGELAARSAGARLLFLLRLYQESLDALRAWIEAHPDDDYPRRLHFSLLKKLHFEEEAEAALGELLRRGGDPTLWLAAAEHYRSTERPREALAQLERAIATSEDAAMRRRQLQLAVEAGDAATARRAAERVLELDPASWSGVVEQMLRIGLFAETEREAERHADDPRATAVLAQLDLFRGDTERAYERAAMALANDPGSEPAITVMVGASLLDGDLERAEAAIAHLKGAPGPALRTWRADLLRRRGDLEAARRELTQLQNDVTGYFAAKLLWVLVKNEIEAEPFPNTLAYDGLLEGQLAALGLEIATDKGHASGIELCAASEAGLARMAGNRTPFPSVVEDGRLRLLDVPPSPRHRVREIQHMSPWLGLACTAERLTAELARIGDHPIARCYAAEMDLWAGNYETARREFEAILAAAPRTTWAWIGLGASQVLLGDPTTGLNTLDEGVRVMGWRGATLPVYRGEALLRIGRLDEAAEELAEACTVHPSRVSAWTLRLVTAAARGRGDEQEQWFDHLERMAPALLADAARDAGIEAWWPGRPSTATQLSLAERALSLMRGNRSSSCAFWLAPGTDTVRAVLHQRPPTSPDWEAHEKRALLRLAKE